VGAFVALRRPCGRMKSRPAVVTRRDGWPRQLIAILQIAREGSRHHPMVVAHTAPPANSVTPAMNITVSNRVISQLLRMARLNCWTVSGVGWA